MTRTLAWLGTALWLALLLGTQPALAADAGPSPGPSPVLSPEPTPSEADGQASVTIIDPSEDPLAGADPESAADTPAPAAATEPASAATPAPTVNAILEDILDPFPGPTEAPSGPLAVPGPGPATDADATSPEPGATPSDLPDDTDVLGGMLGLEEPDTPWGHFELGASVEFFDRLFSLQARLLFTIGRSLIAVALFVIDWVLRFDLGRVLAGVVGPLTDTFAEKVVGGLELRHIALLLAVGHAGWQFMRHRGQAAVAELGLAFAIAATGTFMVSNAPSAACGGLTVLGGLTQGVVSLAVVDDPQSIAEPEDLCAEPAEDEAQSQGGATTPVGAIKASIFETFVREPFLQLQWGGFGEDDGECRAVALEMLAAGAWGDHDHPRERMDDAGCERQARFNAELSAGRVVGTFIYMLVAGAFAFAVIVAAGTLLMAQVAGALLVLAMPFALVAGIAPGTGREMLARWGHAVLKVAILFIGSAFFLVVLIKGVAALQGATADLPVLQRMLSSCVLAWGLVLLRGRIFSNLNFGARSAASRLAGPDALDAPAGSDPGSGAAGGRRGRRGSLAGQLARNQAVKAAAGATAAGRLAVAAAGVYARGRASRLSLLANPASAGGGAAKASGPISPGTVPPPPRSLQLPSPPAHRNAKAAVREHVKGASGAVGRAAGHAAGALGLAAVAGTASTVRAAGSAVVRGVKASTRESPGAAVAVAGGPGVLRPSATVAAGSSSGESADGGPGPSSLAPATRRSLPDPSSLLEQGPAEGEAPEGAG